MTMRIKTYSDLIKLNTFEERFEYLKLNDGRVGEDTFGHLRYLNQQFYKTTLWKHIKRDLIIRDNGCDLGVEGYEIEGRSVYVHHLNPITKNLRSNQNARIPQKGAGSPTALDRCFILSSCSAGNVKLELF